jgi:transposase
MIPEETRSKIRRLFFAEHWKVGTIAAQLGVHRDAVTHAINARAFLAPAMRARAELLDPYRDFLRATLERYPKLCSTRLLEMVQGRGYTGSVYPIRRFVARERPISRHEAFFRLSVLPGEQAQVDWASFGAITVDGARRKLYLFIIVLAWSRAIFARFYLDQTTATFLAAHVAGFHVFGGVPRTILYDNLKSVVLERDGDLVRFHPRILELAGHYHFAPKPCAVARGNEKGRVERRIRDLRRALVPLARGPQRAARYLDRARAAGPPRARRRRAAHRPRCARRGAKAPAAHAGAPLDHRPRAADRFGPHSLRALRSQ